LLWGEPLSLVHYTGRPKADWRAETLRELAIAILACDQRRCRHAIVHVAAFERNVLCLQRRRCCELALFCEPKCLPVLCVASR